VHCAGVSLFARTHGDVWIRIFLRCIVMKRNTGYWITHLTLRIRLVFLCAEPSSETTGFVEHCVVCGGSLALFAFSSDLKGSYRGEVTILTLVTLLQGWVKYDPRRYSDVITNTALYLLLTCLYTCAERTAIAKSCMDPVSELIITPCRSAVLNLQPSDVFCAPRIYFW
jgi:hypothetical protein